MLVIIRIGGSVIASPANPPLIAEYTRLLEKLRKDGHKIAAVVGGGALARQLIKTGEELDLSEEAQDWLAIHVSRLHALIITLRLKIDDVGSVPTSINKAVKALNKDGIVVMGGLRPGMTTDTVAAQLAQRTKAKLLVKATDQEGIYDKDPRKYKDAKKLDRLTYSNLAKLFELNRHKAGIHQILDPMALKILKETKVKTVIVNGDYPENIQKAIKGRKVGTLITEQDINKLATKATLV